MRKLIDGLSADLKIKGNLIKVLLRTLYVYFHPLSGNIKPLLLYRISNFFWRKKMKRMALFCYFWNGQKFGCYIASSANIGKGVKFEHPIGVVIGFDVEIGDNCIIYQNTTIGRKEINTDGYPHIGNSVTIYPGSVIIGNVNIGNNSIIGANSLVAKDVPPNCIFAGNPAKQIKVISN